MPKLIVIAENICGARSPFVLLGQEPKKKQGRKQTRRKRKKSTGKLFDLTTEWHTVIKIESPGVDPGEHLAKDAEVDYDMRHLSWIVPPKLRGRFHLKRLTWGDHNLIKKPGIV